MRRGSVDFVFGAALAAALLAGGCKDAVAPPRGAGAGPAFVQVGSQEEISGRGTLGSGDSTPGSNLQQFDFEVRADLTGRVFYRDWKPGYDGASITVDSDTATKITAFHDGWSACADSTHGAQVSGMGRVSTTPPKYEFFIVRACDDGASGSGADRFELTDGNPPPTGYDRDSLISSGDIVKTVTSTSGDGTGSLRIKTVTTGDSIPNGYTVSASGPASGSASIGANASETFGGLPTGDYSLQLNSVPSNCTVSGANPRTIAVNAGETDSTTFSVSCVGATSSTGSLKITTATTGDSIPSGYTFSVTGPSGSATDTIGVNSSRTFANITTGDYSVTLSGVPANCTVSGGTSRTVTVPAGGTGTAAYSVSCSAATSSTGNLTVSTSTSGSSLPSGYSVTVDGGQTKSIGINGSVTFSGLSASDHSVALTDVPGNCTVGGSNPRTVSVSAGGTATTTFSVSCTAPVGNLLVTTSTTGSSIPSGYTLSVSGPGGASTQAIGANTSVTLSNLATGDYTVSLTSVPSNCTLSGSASHTVTVSSGGTAATTFSISCVTPNQSPSVNAGSDQTVLVGLLYSLNWSFSDPDNGPWSYTINWGDGSSSSGSASSPGSLSTSHTYILIGSYTIRVTVRDNAGASGSDTKVLTVVTPLPGLP